MKFSTSIVSALAVAPLALATYDPLMAREDVSLSARDGHKGNDKKGGDRGGNGQDTTVIIDNTGSGADLISGISGNSDKVIIIWVNNGAGAPTQTVNPQVTVTQTVTVAPDGGVATTDAPLAVSTHTVNVGGAAGLIYQPDQLQAAVGDMVIFKFQSQNHTVTQSTFDQPCVPLEGGMKSGFVPNPNNTISPEPMIAMQVMTPDPIWMYCAQANHCGKGMVFSLNPTVEKTHAAFQSAAIAQFGGGEASPITGGAPPAEAPPAAAPPADPAAPPADPNAGVSATPSTPDTVATATQSIAIGTGTALPDGLCQCVAVCGADSFPAVAGSFGGIAGGLPSRMIAIGG